jgi:hypothetical protein
MVWKAPHDRERLPDQRGVQFLGHPVDTYPLRSIASHQHSFIRRLNRRHTKYTNSHCDRGLAVVKILCAIYIREFGELKPSLPPNLRVMNFLFLVISIQCFGILDLSG